MPGYRIFAFQLEKLCLDLEQSIHGPLKDWPLELPRVRSSTRSLSPIPVPHHPAPPPTPRPRPRRLGRERRGYRGPRYRLLQAPRLSAGFGVRETAPVALSSASASGTMPSAALKSPRLRRVFVVGVGMTKVNGAVRPRGDREAWPVHGHRPHCCPAPFRFAWASERPLGSLWCCS